MPSYYEYFNVPLKVYCNIVSTKNVALLLISGELNIEQAHRQWEKIVKQVEEEKHSLYYYNHLEDLQFIRDHMAEYIIIKASLSKLLYKVDLNLIKELAEQDYLIDIKHGNEAYARSVYDNLQRINNNITKIEMKQNEMALGNADKTEAPTFDSTMAQLTMALGFCVPEDITLARANQYTALLSKKNKTKEQQNG